MARKVFRARYNTEVFSKLVRAPSWTGARLSGCVSYVRPTDPALGESHASDQAISTRPGWATSSPGIPVLFTRTSDCLRDAMAGQLTRF
ncbi:hypothetical protein ON010_g4106 [Phytophthora cinnamomi]|nr:hypothetical protein ON010_g4106 [Phytophthora cinnamomi]